LDAAQFLGEQPRDFIVIELLGGREGAFGSIPRMWGMRGAVFRRDAP
jgi:hypothetical protein